MNQHNHDIKEIQRILLSILEDVLLKDKRKIEPKNDKNYLPYDGQAIESNLKKILELKGKRSEDDKIITFENDKYKFIKESSKIYVINKQNGAKIFEKGHFTKWASNEDAHYLKNIQTLVKELLDDIDSENDLKCDGSLIQSSIEKILEIKGITNDDGTITYDTESYRFIKQGSDIYVVNKQDEEVIFQNGELTENASVQDVDNLNSYQEFASYLERGQAIQKSIEDLLKITGTENDDGTISYETKGYIFIKKLNDISAINKQNQEVIFQNSEFTENASDEDVENLNSFPEYVEEFIDSLGEEEPQTQKINYSPSLKLTS